MSSKVIILRGPSGAGKSTYIDSLGGWVAVCSADKFFIKKVSDYKHTNEPYQYVFDKDKLGEAHASCMRKYIDNLNGLTPYDDHPIIVDNTSASIEEISPYMLVAAAYGVPAEIHNIPYKHLTVEQLAARNKHGVSAKVIKNQIWRIEHARLPSYWTVVNVEPKE